MTFDLFRDKETTKLIYITLPPPPLLGENAIIQLSAAVQQPLEKNLGSTVDFSLHQNVFQCPAQNVWNKIRIKYVEQKNIPQTNDPVMDKNFVCC